MNITIVNVDVTTPAGKKYNQAEVIFKNESGQVQNKKLFSFNNPSVFAALKDAKSGDQFSITQVKNDKGYWDWTAASSGASAPASQAAPATAAPSRQVNSNYETKEERAFRQRLIVRQSSLSSAVACLSPGAKSSLDPDAVLALAERFNEWVFKEPDLFFEGPNDLE